MFVTVFVITKMHINNSRTLPCLPIFLYTKDGVCLSLQMSCAQDAHNNKKPGTWNVQM